MAWRWNTGKSGQLRLYPATDFRYQAGRRRHGAAVFGVETAGYSQVRGSRV
jgi:hypothetical protein